MTDDLTAARERHRLYSITGHCRDCGFKWPCDAALAIALADELAEALRYEASLHPYPADVPDLVRAALAKWEASHENVVDTSGDTG